MRRVRPPGDFGPSGETRALWRKWEENSRRRAEFDEITRQPGGRGLLMRALFLDREAQVREAIEATTDPAERARLSAHADELRRLADNAEHEAKEYDAMKTAKQIMADAGKRFRDIGARFAQVREADDKNFPPSDQAWRSQQRAELRREWQLVESQTYAAVTEWREAERQRHTTAYHQDPLGDAAAETRRMREESETAALTAQYMGQRVMARNRLLPQAHEALAVGNVARAQVILNAAKRIGIEDARLEHAITTTLDQTLPHRKAALEGLGRVEQEVDAIRLAVVTERQASGIGTSTQQVRDSSYRKMLEYRQQQGLIIDQSGGSNGSGDGSGDGAAAGAGASGGAAGE